MSDLTHLYLWESQGLGEAYGCIHELANADFQLFELVPLQDKTLILFTASSKHPKFDENFVGEVSSDILGSMFGLSTQGLLENLIVLESSKGLEFLRTVLLFVKSGARIVDLRWARGRHQHHAILTSEDEIELDSGLKSVVVTQIKRPNQTLKKLFEYS